MADQAAHPDGVFMSCKLSVFPPPEHDLMNERILIAQIQNVFALCVGP